MINEGKSALKQLFCNFDKNKSGSIEEDEIKAIAKELNQEITQQEMKQLMSVIDVDGDGKITFQEFWDWWQYGKNGKLEALVFTKLKAMNLVKKIHSEFTRQGMILMQKYSNSGLDNHYFCINHGVDFGLINFKTNLKILGKSIQNEIDQAFPDYKIQENESLQIILTLQSEDPEQGKIKIQEWFDELQVYSKSDKSQDEEIWQIIHEILEYTELKITNNEEIIRIHLNIKHPFFQDFFDSEYLPFFEAMGENNLITGEINIGIKNGFKKMVTKNLPFVQWLLEGFIFELSLQVNCDLIKNIFDALMGILGYKYGKNKSQKSYLIKCMALPLLLKSSKFHLTFKNMKDVDKFFAGLGLSTSLKGQPSGFEMIQSISEDFGEILNDNTNLMNKLLSILEKYTISQGQLSIIIPHLIGCINFSIDGLTDLYNAVIHGNKQ